MNDQEMNNDVKPTDDFKINEEFIKPNNDNNTYKKNPNRVSAGKKLADPNKLKQ